MGGGRTGRWTRGWSTRRGKQPSVALVWGQWSTIRPASAIRSRQGAPVGGLRRLRSVPRPISARVARRVCASS